MDEAQVLNAVTTFLALTVTGLVSIAASMVVSYARRRLLHDTVQSAAHSAAGTVLVALQTGQMTVADLHVNDSQLMQIAFDAVGTVFEQAAKLGITPSIMARLVVGYVGRALAADPTTTTVAPLPRPTPLPRPASPAPSSASISQGVDPDVLKALREIRPASVGPVPGASPPTVF